MSRMTFSPADSAGLIATPVRLVTGWLFFSAFWRRVALAPHKLDPGAANYVGHKFNQFLPHALFIKPMLQHLISHPTELHAFLILFTVIEAAVGLALLAGCCTRMAALGAALMSLGILLGAGWLGTTCLDEWQIGSIGLASGLTLMLAGAGPWSIDRLIASYKINAPLVQRLTDRWRQLFESPRLLSVMAGSATAVAVFWTLLTNQIFFNGIWGKLHNPSALPHVEISNIHPTINGLQFAIYRDGGPDTYASFVMAMSVRDKAGNVLFRNNLAGTPALESCNIKNHNLVKIKSNDYGLVLPLGGKADVAIGTGSPATLPVGEYILTLTDVSGLQWSAPFSVSAQEYKACAIK